MRWLLAATFAASAAAQPLPAKLDSWRAEIEAAGGAPVFIARVAYDSAENTLSLPDDTPRRELFAQYLRQDEFVLQFREMYGAMVHHRRDGGAFLIMLNMARAADFRGQEDAVLAHELGHAWIKARAYPAPIFQPGLAGCLAVHTGDIAQHVLIRKELDVRGIEYRPFWKHTLDLAAEAAAAGKAAPEEDRCVRVRQAAQLIDVELGLPAGEYAGRERYRAALLKLYPEIAGTVTEIVAWLKDKDLEKRAVHRAALNLVFERLKALAYTRSKHYIL